MPRQPSAQNNQQSQNNSQLFQSNIQRQGSVFISQIVQNNGDSEPFQVNISNIEIVNDRQTGQGNSAIRQNASRWSANSSNWQSELNRSQFEFVRPHSAEQNVDDSQDYYSYKQSRDYAWSHLLSGARGFGAKSALKKLQGPGALAAYKLRDASEEVVWRNRGMLNAVHNSSDYDIKTGFVRLDRPAGRYVWAEHKDLNRQAMNAYIENNRSMVRVTSEFKDVPREISDIKELQGTKHTFRYYVPKLVHEAGKANIIYKGSFIGDNDMKYRSDEYSKNGYSYILKSQMKDKEEPILNSKYDEYAINAWNGAALHGHLPYPLLNEADGRPYGSQDKELNLEKYLFSQIVKYPDGTKTIESGLGQLSHVPGYEFPFLSNAVPRWHQGFEVSAPLPRARPNSPEESFEDQQLPQDRGLADLKTSEVQSYFRDRARAVYVSDAGNLFGVRPIQPVFQSQVLSVIPEDISGSF
ncbi:MAG: hypothetical protein KF874_08430 [Rhizobiaceae bacterium]|nr:hypothetical protein [Rhizobiaceae bacterium]